VQTLRRASTNLVPDGAQDLVIYRDQLTEVDRDLARRPAQGWSRPDARSAPAPPPPTASSTPPQSEIRSCPPRPFFRHHPIRPSQSCHRLAPWLIAHRHPPAPSVRRRLSVAVRHRRPARAFQPQPSCPQHSQAKAASTCRLISDFPGSAKAQIPGASAMCGFVKRQNRFASGQSLLLSQFSPLCRLRPRIYHRCLPMKA
jgi:hypothetical protein